MFVWALLFVGIFGSGALVGRLAIAFRSIGFVGNLFGKAIEETAAVRSKRLTLRARPGVRA